MTAAVPVVIALGSNLGDRRSHLAWAAEALGAFVSGLRLSPVIETDAVGVPDAQPPYLNAVAVGTTTVPAADLLEGLLEIEQRRGRVRTGLRSARTLDLDLILYGDLVTESDALSVPHPRFRERRFVLEPLAAIAPDVVDPVTGKTAAELADALRAVGSDRPR